MSKGFGSRSSKIKRNVKQLYLDSQFSEGEKYYLMNGCFFFESVLTSLTMSYFSFPKMGL